ncbi:hypothetical protein [Streptomyces sp. NPDC002785]|uniref:hypothetical protein n=1 Tax=Streptomyces sp. NPDC002785 TaxID=3154543 RepID=UPI003328270F
MAVYLKRLFGDGWWRITVIGLAGAAILSTAGCSTSGSGSESTRDTRTQALSANLRLPVEKYLFSRSDIEKIDQARFILVNKCLRRFKVSNTLTSPGPPPGPATLTERRYGLADKEVAENDGYHFRETSKYRSLAAQIAPLDAGKKKELERLLSGGSASDERGTFRVNGMKIPADGCIGEATEKISGSPGDPARQLNFRSFAAAKADSRVKRAFTDWSACLKEEGYTYPDPLAAMSDPRFQDASPARDERKTAVADVACKRRTHLIDVWFDVETAEQEKLIAEEQASFTAALELKKKQLATAAAILTKR